MAQKNNGEALGPVAKARTIFELAHNLPRGEAIDLAVNVAGVRRSTASTQYQNWKNQHNHG